MTEDVFNSQQAREYLGLKRITFERYIADPEIPLTGTKLTENARMFTKDELDTFREYMQENGLPRKRGRPFDPQAKYHGRHEKYKQRPQQPVDIQRVADALKEIVQSQPGNPVKRKAAVNAINHFETLHYYADLFAQYCPAFKVQEDGSVVFTGEGSIYQAVIDALAAYERAVQG